VGSWEERPPITIKDNWGFAFAPNSEWLAAETGNGAILLVDPETGKEYSLLEDPNHKQAQGINISPDSTRLVTYGFGGQPISVWNLRVIGRHLEEIGLRWDLPLSPLTDPNPRPEPLRVKVELNAELYALSGHYHLTLNQFDKAIADYQEALARDPKHLAACNSLAWVYVTGPPEVRDAAKALPLALKAVQSAQKADLYLNTLGVVYYRLGQWDKAVATLQDADKADIKQEHRAWNLYFLAMSYHQLGESAKAQKAYWEVIAWQKQAKLKPDQVEELNAFRVEAEALLKKPAKPSS
jgi:tetratricopeptide (TPR) repeat protein